MKYFTELGRKAQKDLRSLTGSTLERIWKRLRELERDPSDTRISKLLTNMEGARTSRVGDWRIVYRINRSNFTIAIVAIQRRDKVYKQL